MVARNHHSFLKKVTYATIGLFGFSFVVLLSLPTFLSTSIGQQFFLKQLSSRLRGSFEVKELSLSWWDSQEISGFKMSQPAKEFAASCEKIHLDTGLFSLLVTKDFRKITLSQFFLHVGGKGISLFSERNEEVPPLTSPISLQSSGIGLDLFDLKKGIWKGLVVGEGGKISFSTPIDFSQVSFSLLLDKVSTLELHATTSQEKSSGEVSLFASLDQFVPITMKMEAKQLPVVGIDQMVSLFSPRMEGVFSGVIGPTLDADLFFEGREGNFSLNLVAHSETFATTVATQTKNGTLSLQSPGSVTLSITPNGWEKLSRAFPVLDPVQLVQGTTFQCTIPTLSFPTPMENNNWQRGMFECQLTTSSPVSFLFDKQAFSLSEPLLTMSSTELGQGILIKGKGSLDSKEQRAPFEWEGTLSPSPRLTRGIFSLSVEQFPSCWLQQLIPSPLLGDLLNVKLQLELAPPSIRCRMNLQSPLISLPDLDISLGNTLTLIQPATITYQFTDQLLQFLFPNSQLHIREQIPVEWTIQECTVPLQQIENTTFASKMSTPSLKLVGPHSFKFDKLEVGCALNKGRQLDLKIESSSLKGGAQGTLHLAKKEMVFTKPTLIEWTIDQGVLASLIPNLPFTLSPTPLNFSLDPFTLSWNTPHFVIPSCRGMIQFSNLAVLLPALPPLQMSEGNLPFQWDPTLSSFSFQFNGSLEEKGSIGAKASFTGIDLEKNPMGTSAQVSADLQNISTSWIELVTRKKEISSIVGPTFQCKFTGQKNGEKQQGSIHWTSPLLSMNLSMALSDNTLAIQGANQQLSWIVTPAGYKALNAWLVPSFPSPFEIQEGSTFTCSIDKFSCPIALKDFSEALIDVTVRNPKLSFVDKVSKEGFLISSLTSQVKQGGGKEPFSFSLDASILTQNSASSSPKQGNLSLLSSLNFRGKTLSELSGNCVCKAQQLPSSVLDLFAVVGGRNDRPATTFFGKTIDLNASATFQALSGPVEFVFSSPNVRASLSGQVANGLLTLKNNFYAQVKISPQLSHLFLSEVNPLNLSSISSKDPISLEIPAKGVQVPLYPFRLDLWEVPSCRIELGKIACRNEGNVNIALSLLKSKQFDKSQDLMLWFAPIDLKMKKGILDIERTEILLADTFDIAVWGKVDLLKQLVDMQLGLPSSTLRKAFGIKKLPESYVLTIPMKGKMDNVQIDTGKATAKVALLLAWQQAEAAGALGGGPAGALLGGVLGKVAILPDQNAKIPPAKHPFPWEVSKKNKQKTSESDQTHEKKRHFKQNEKPFKQILKVIR